MSNNKVVYIIAYYMAIKIILMGSIYQHEKCLCHNVKWKIIKNYICTIIINIYDYYVYVCLKKIWS